MENWRDVSELPTNGTQQAAVAVVILFTVLAFIAWVLRIVSRYQTKQWGIDDYLITVAMILSIGMLPPTYMFYRYNFMGFRTEDIPMELFDFRPGMFWNWIMQVLYNPILALVKSSVLFFLLRLGFGNNPKVKWTIHGLNIFNILQMIAIFFVVIFQQIPVKAFWEDVPVETSIDGPVFYIVTAAITILTDILVLAIPIYIFIGLKMRLAAKLGLIFVFLLGGVVAIVGIVRLHQLYSMFYTDEDSRHTLGVTLNTIEVNVAIISACGPAMKPLFRKMMPGVFSSGASKPGYYASGRSARLGTNPNSRMGGSQWEPETGTHQAGAIGMKNLRSRESEAADHSPSGSEVEIVRYGDIVKKTDIQVAWQDEGPEEASNRRDVGAAR